VNLCATTRSSHKTRNSRSPPASANKAHAIPSQHQHKDTRSTRLTDKQFIIPTFFFGVQKARCMIDTSAPVSFCNEQVLDSLRSHQNLQHQDIHVQSYNRKPVVSLGDGSTATAEESVDINLQFSTDELQAQCAVLPTLPHGIDLILGNDFLSKFDVLIRPARAECSWYSESQKKHLVIHGCSTIIPVHCAPHRYHNHPDGRADQLRHHILTLGTHSESESDIEIVSSVELGKRLQLLREKAQNKRMHDPSLSVQDSLHDEVAYVLTTASLLKAVQSVVVTDQKKRWNPQEGGSKRQKSSDFRKCENTSCSAAAINRTCARHPKRLMMACSALLCHKEAKKSAKRTTCGFTTSDRHRQGRRRDRRSNGIERLFVACTDSAYAQTGHA
jgi:hypothetical protein